MQMIIIPTVGRRPLESGSSATVCVCVCVSVSKLAQLNLQSTNITPQLIFKPLRSVRNTHGETDLVTHKMLLLTCL